MEQYFNTPMSASLARRLAEAADGFRNAGNIYFVVELNFPHAIKAFIDKGEADKYFKEKNLPVSEWGLFGPFKTDDEVKTGLNVEKIREVVLKISYKDKTPDQQIIFNGPIDALFFNLSAFEKFVFPYYAGLYGIEYTAKMREKLLEIYRTALQASKPLPAIPHANLTLMLGLERELAE